MTSKDAEKEFEEFVLANEEKVLEIIRNGRTKVNSRVSTEIDKSKNLVKEVLEAFLDKDVQEHFVSMGFEMLMGIGSLIKALPLPKELDPLIDAFNEKEEVLRDFTKKHKEPTAKKKKPPVEKIELK